MRKEAAGVKRRLLYNFSLSPNIVWVIKQNKLK
jgi:hypothetical protein